MPPPVRSRCRVPPLDFSAGEWKELGEVPREGAETAFLLAAYDDDVPKLRELVAAGNPDMNPCHDNFPSALEVAVQCNDITALDIPLDAGARRQNNAVVAKQEVTLCGTCRVARKLIGELMISAAEEHEAGIDIAAVTRNILSARYIARII